MGRFNKLVLACICLLLTVSCVSRQSIVVPQATPFNHPALSQLISQKVLSDTDAVTFGESRRYRAGDIKVVVLKGSPFEIGYAHGKLLKQEIEERMKYFLYLIKSKSLGTDIGINIMMKRAKTIEKKIPGEYVEELRGISAGADVDYGTLLTINVLATTGYNFGCTSFAFKARDSKITCSRQFDWPGPDLFYGMVLFIIKPDNGFGFACIDMPGFVSAYTGINENGITVATHYLPGIRQNIWNVLPRTIMKRHLLQYSKTIDDVGKKLEKANTQSVGMLFISSKKGAAVFELANDMIERIDMKDRYLVLSNHGRIIRSKVAPDSVDRLTYATRYLEEHIDSMNIEKAITSNRSSLIARSRYGNQNKHSVIFSPQDLNFWVAMAPEPQLVPACFGPYIGFNLLHELYGSGQRPHPPSFPEKQK